MPSNVPQAYLDAIVVALSALRPGSSFVPADEARIFASACGRALPATSAPADCEAWVNTLSLDDLESLAGKLTGLPKELRQPIACFARFETIVNSRSLATLRRPLVINRREMVDNMRRLRDHGDFVALRVVGPRGSGLSFTGEIVKHMLGIGSGTDHDVLVINLARLAENEMEKATKRILEWIGAPAVLPEPDDNTEAAYPGQLATHVVRELINRTTIPARKWLVFDRCSQADESFELKSFLIELVETLVQNSGDVHCPRIVLVEGSEDLVIRQGNTTLDEQLAEISDPELSDALTRRGVLARDIPDAIAEIRRAVLGRPAGAECLRVLQLAAERAITSRRQGARG
jgi:hypothetical protein